MNQDLSNLLFENWRARVDKRLERSLDISNVAQQRVLDAMRYSTLQGGKRIRPLLVYATARALGIEEELVDEAAAAVELIHAYSLVHDDLPAMDDDQLRRGKPTCHIGFDEATAILAGDGLQSRAFQLLSENPVLSAEIKIEQVNCLAKAAGAEGMVGGQMIDLLSENRSISLEQLEEMHRLKTGALIRASVLLAAIAAQSPSETMELLTRFSDCIGLAFQIQDDILDHTASTEQIGKTAGADAALNKSTYVSLLGLDQSRNLAGSLYNEAVNSLHSLGSESQELRSLAKQIVVRSH